MTAPQRRGRAARQSAPAARQVNYRQLRNPFTPQRVFSDDETAGLHATALRVLQELGIKILLPEARSMLAAAGALVDDDMVRIGADMVAAALATAPASIPMRAPNPARNQTYENGALIFSAAGGCPNVSDATNGRRPGDLASFVDAIKLVQSFDVIHKMPIAPEAQNIPVNLRHLETTLAQLTYADKLLTVFARGTGQAEQCFEMIQIGLNLSADEFTGATWVSAVINSNSPRMLDVPMAQGIIDFARAGQMTIITPFCLAGAMAPVTVAGALVLQHAEALAGIVLAQVAKPGAPVSYGGFSSNVDMKSGAPAFGTPEHIKMQFGAGQLARHIGLPWRSAAGSAGNTTDPQSIHENIMGLWGAMSAGATLTLHSAGWLEGGLTFGFEKFICDVEAVQTLAELCAPVDASVAGMAFEAIKGVDPGGHFFASPHTMERFDTAFYAPINADLSTFGTWAANGAQQAEDRAAEIVRRTLADYSQPAGCAEAADRVARFVADKRARGGAAPLTG